MLPSGPKMFMLPCVLSAGKPHPHTFGNAKDPCFLQLNSKGRSESVTE